MLDIVVKVVAVLGSLGTISGVSFGVYAFFNTIHPVFEKENELLNAKTELELIQSTYSETVNDLDFQKEKLREIEVKLKDERHKLSSLLTDIKKYETETTTLKQQINELKNDAERASFEAIKAHCLIIMSDVVDEAIRANYSFSYSLNNTDNYDIKKYSIERCEDYREREKKNGYKYKASIIFQSFTVEKLTSKSTYNDVIDFIPWFGMKSYNDPNFIDKIIAEQNI